MAEVKILGVKETISKMKRIEVKVLKQGFRKGLRRGAAEIRDAARAGVPVDMGLLARSIAVKDSRGKKNEIVTKVSAPVYYALFVEYGTSKMGARPFMRDAVRTKEDRVHELLISDIQALINSETKAA